MKTLALSIFGEVDYILCICHCGSFWLAGKNWRRGIFLQGRGPVDLEFGNRMGISLRRILIRRILEQAWKSLKEC
jgi:hypothetical protein